MNEFRNRTRIGTCNGDIGFADTQILNYFLAVYLIFWDFWG